MSLDMPDSGSTNITWANVGLALSFIGFNVVLSGVLGLGVGTSLAIAAARCIIQLGMVAIILARVFLHENPWMTAGIALLLNVLGALEIVVNKSPRRYSGMFLSVLVAMIGSTIPIAIIGSTFGIQNDPFWKPIKFIPILGMLCGSTITGIAVAVGSILRELCDNREKVEMMLAFGASRMEACRPIVREALRTALTPSINNMSVLGIISIPGMMTGAILGGASVEQAAKLQMIIVFMNSASTALASMYTAISVVAVTIDGEHRIRDDRIQEGGHLLVRLKEAVGQGMGSGLGCVYSAFAGLCRKKIKKMRSKHFGKDKGGDDDERTSLLGNAR